MSTFNTLTVHLFCRQVVSLNEWQRKKGRVIKEAYIYLKACPGDVNQFNMTWFEPSAPQLIETVSATDKDEMAHRQHFHFSLDPEVAKNHSFSLKDNRGVWHTKHPITESFALKNCFFQAK